jgi:hypothetical protein
VTSSDISAARLAGSDTFDADAEDDDPLRPARGIFFGLVAGGILWAAIIWLIVRMVA